MDKDNPKSFEIPVWFLGLFQKGSAMRLFDVLRTFPLHLGPVKADQTVTITFKEAEK